MPTKVHTSKVLCYIVRDGQLLVFRHADYDLEHVGIQVPAGSIRHGESPEAVGPAQYSITQAPGRRGERDRPHAYPSSAVSRYLTGRPGRLPDVHDVQSQRPAPNWPIGAGRRLVPVIGPGLARVRLA
jgi:hypothetical protein